MPNLNLYGFCGAGTTSKQPDIRYASREDMTAEQHKAALAAIYRRAIERYENKHCIAPDIGKLGQRKNPAAGPSGRGVKDATETKEDCAYGRSVP